MDGSGADVVAGASQKCLELPPGLAPVAVSDRAWDYMQTMKNRRVPYILDFLAWEQAWIDMHNWHPQPVTGSTNMLYALDWVVDNIIEEGMENRQERFRAAGKRLKDGFSALGFTPAADPLYASPVVSEIITPDNIPSDDFREYCIKKHNVMIGYGRRKNNTDHYVSFRIAHFGLAAENERVDLMINIAAEFLRERKA